MSRRNLYEYLEDMQLFLDNLKARTFIDYETSAWTPTYSGGTAAGVTTYTFQSGIYTRMGNRVDVSGGIIWTAATGTGNAQISLPFTPVSRGAGALFVAGVTFANGTPQIQIAAQPFFLMYSPLTNAAGAIVQMEAAGEIRFTLTIFV